MKKLALLALVVMTLFPNLNAQKAPADIQLPDPKIEGGMPLMEALKNRATIREYSDKALDNQQLANLLWAACGVNRPDGKRTAPTARNAQQIDVYVYTEKGVYLYVAEKNLLKGVASGDHRADAAMQPFAAKCPILLVFVANYDKMKGFNDEAREFYGATDAGYVSQNVYLYCASEGLATVVLGSIHRDKIKDLLGFNGKAILGQPVGFQK
jgi:SagB-type dehydrogenase family enzyme